MDETNIAGVIPSTMQTQIYKVAAQAAANAVASFTLSEYMNRKRASEWIGVAPQSLDKYTRLGMPCHIIDGHKLWKRSEMVAWLDQYKQ